MTFKLKRQTYNLKIPYTILSKGDLTALSFQYPHVDNVTHCICKTRDLKKFERKYGKGAFTLPQHQKEFELLHMYKLTPEALEYYLNDNFADEYPHDEWLINSIEWLQNNDPDPSQLHKAIYIGYAHIIKDHNDLPVKRVIYVDDSTATIWGHIKDKHIESFKKWMESQPDRFSSIGTRTKFYMNQAPGRTVNISYKLHPTDEEWNKFLTNKNDRFNIQKELVAATIANEWRISVGKKPKEIWDYE